METQTASYVTAYLNKVKAIAAKMPSDAIDRIIKDLMTLRSGGGRLFFLGLVEAVHSVLFYLTIFQLRQRVARRLGAARS